ncbi:MAG: hypothetical protein HOB03_06770 [Gammaproteobacteria bacterium]|nr:hypothetical protein [Gammaproteobacteria bacterium]
MNRQPFFQISILFLSAALVVAGAVLTYPHTSTAGDRQQIEGEALNNLTPNHQLEVNGINHSQQPQTLVIRLDDREAPGYSERVNLERVVPSGPFQINLGLGGLYTPSGKLLTVADLQQIVAFQGQGDKGGLLEITPLKINHSPSLPEGVKGWDLGASESRLWPGFTRLTPESGLFTGSMLQSVERGKRQQASDPLTSDGIRGIASLQLPLAAGEWHLTLWISDPGEWEYLPHPLRRTIHANQQLVYQHHYTPQQWIEQVYLSGLKQEATLNDNAWSHFGSKSGSVKFEVHLSEEGLLLELGGPQPEAGYLAAILAEPAGQHTNQPLQTAIEKQRSQWWHRSWPIQSTLYNHSPKPTLKPEQLSVVAAADTTAYLEFELQGGRSTAPPKITLTPPRYRQIALDTTLRWGMWRLRRAKLSSTLLQLNDHHLRGGPLPPNNPGLPRQIHIQVAVPAEATPGTYRGKISITIDQITLQAPMTIIVPDLTLPKIDRPIGVYLEHSVHFGWFKELHQQQQQSLQCDLKLLQQQGISGIAPPLPTPATASTQRQLLQQLNQLDGLGFTPPYLAYTPVKRMVARKGVEQMAIELAKMEQQLRQAQLPPPLWAIADEPSNASSNQPSPQKIARYIRSYAPNAQLAGQLNHPQDMKGIESYDIALLNSGFGIDGHQLDAVRDRGVTPWLYNLNPTRIGAGFYLWRNQGEGYLQWHGRMPTADPFDPTDGREADMQLLLPHATPCPLVADVDRKLFDLSEAITDLRWLLWLEQKAIDNPAASQLLHQLQLQIPTRWEAIEKLPHWQSKQWRKLITTFAL